MAINTFSDTPAIGATGIVSTINTSELLSYLTGDEYFQTTGDITRIDLYFTHTGDRQEKRIIHTGVGLTGDIAWSNYAKSGIWRASRVMALDTDGAIHEFEGITGSDIIL